MTRRWFSAALLACASLVPSLGEAQAPPPSDSDIATARKLTVEGLAALEQKDFVRAEGAFTKADALYHAPTVSLGLARARAALGKLVGAQEAYSRVVHTTVPADASPAFVKAIEDARRELDALTPRVPSVIIQVKGSATPKVTVDGVEVPSAALGEQRPVDPGKHVVRANAPGFAASEATVTLAEGKTETVTLELKPGESTPLVQAPPGGSPAAVPGGEPGGGDGGASHASPRGPIGFAAVGSASRPG
jgi:PEGA domain